MQLPVRTLSSTRSAAAHQQPCTVQAGSTQSFWSSLDIGTQQELNSFCLSNLFSFNWNLLGCMEVCV